MPDGPVYVVGDVHGCLDQTILLLRRAGLMSEALTWTGDTSTLWFSGDFADRGPHGLAAIDLAMWLQREAVAVGGRVDALLGNHDLLLIAARRFGGSFLTNWRRNGGLTADLKGLKARHANWLVSRPAMAAVGDHLLIHADADFYTRWGDNVDGVNQTIAEILESGDPEAWNELVEQFSERHAFDTSSPGGTERAAAFLRHFHAGKIVHGHTPISYVTGQSPTDVVEPLVYANGLCVNVDGGLYLGGPGIIYKFSDDNVSPS